MRIRFSTEKITNKIAKGLSPCMFYCNFTDFLLQNLCEDSIEVIEDCIDKDEKTDQAYLAEAKFNMQYAKWFRPVLGVSLTILVLVGLMICDRYKLISYFKALYQSQVPPERLDIVFSLTLITGSKLFALAIDAMIGAVGLYLLICFLQGAISIVAAIFWLCV